MSVYGASTGTQVATAILGPAGTYSFTLPQSSCAGGGGYKLLGIPNVAGYETRWYGGATNFTEAACVSLLANTTGIDWTLPPAGLLEGDLHQDPTHQPIPYGVVYAFDASSGTLRSWAVADSQGRFVLSLPEGGFYKILAHAAGYAPTWCCPSASSFGGAQSIPSPSLGHMVMLAPSSAIQGTVQDSGAQPQNEVRVYAWRASDGAYAGLAVTGRGGTPGQYTLPLPSGTYKLLARPPVAGLADHWYPTPAAWGFGDAGEVGAPSSGIDFTLEPAASITGQVFCEGFFTTGPVGVSAFESSGTRAGIPGISDATGAYGIKVRAGYQYKIRFDNNGSCTAPGAHQVAFYSDSTNFTEGLPLTPPQSGINQDLVF